ncbi:prepilin peptidase [Dickeya aquatica]|uniref:Prepilin leader peptidase/N-methyltransferase n=1 Tax=Dickeya aquatica TaxID=1401087 RepID=A0A375A8L3_9GAMM|nr:A24 family peptidase [Dickeya aquatica]SLM62256.1 Leader peptidase (Prepilin peptidase) / N-methyltransferase [Dickeya aquatica]
MDLLAFASAFPRVWLATLLLLGVMIGSFLNVVIYRLPQMLERRWQQEARFHLNMPAGVPASRYDLIWPPSSCPHCSKRLRVIDNIPLLSWLWLRGRAHCCGGEVSWRYPLTELLTGALFMLAGALWQPGFALLGASVCFSLLLVLATIDARTQLLPDVLTFPLLWLGLAFNLSDTFVPLSEAVIGALAGYLSLWLIYWAFRLLSGREALGHGDFKLLSALGAWVGWQALPNLVLIASLAGLVITLVWRSVRRMNMQQPLAFGPWLALAGAIALILNALGNGSY